jgi:hypothetical protein
MSCMLRVGGQEFDIDAFTASNKLIPDSLWRKGDKRFPKSETSTKINETSGFRIAASDAEMSELDKQIDETIIFIRDNQHELRKAIRMPGVEVAVFDFGCEIHPPGWSSFTFPPEILTLAGSIGASLCISVYPTDDESEENV